jgi:signal transduction histidine kinase
MERLSTTPEVKRFLLKAIAVPLALAAGLVVLSIFLIGHFRSNQASATHSDQILYACDILEVAAIDAKDDFDAYWFSSKKTYLESAVQNEKRFDEAAEHIRQLVAANPTQIELLKSVTAAFDEWRDFSKSVITVRPSEISERAIGDYIEKGRQLSARVLNLAETLLYNEREFRTIRAANTNMVATQSIMTITIITLLIAGVFAVYGRQSLQLIKNIYGKALASEQKSLEGAHTALATRDEFLSVASHELKTPLTSLKLQLQMTERALHFRADPSPIVRHLKYSNETALRQVNSLADLIDQLLDISKIQSGRFVLSIDKTDLTLLIKDVTARYANQFRTAKTPLQLDLQDSLVGHWDRFRLEQVIVNLLSNAIKYAPRNPIAVSCRVADEKAILEVRDFGPGICKEKQNKIFERFERANSSKTVAGLGLGLFIAKSIVVAHGGSIRVDEAIPQGSRFVVELPLIANPVAYKGAYEEIALGESYVI